MIHHLPKQYKVSRKEINIDDPYDGSKLFTTILIDMTLFIFLLTDNYLQDQAWRAQKARHVALDGSVPTAKNYGKHIYFVFKLGEPALLGSKKIVYEYACIS